MFNGKSINVKTRTLQNMISKNIIWCVLNKTQKNDIFRVMEVLHLKNTKSEKTSTPSRKLSILWLKNKPSSF